MRKLAIAACIVAAAVPWAARPAGPLNWDVFVDGQRYATTLGIGENVTDANVAVEIAPATQDGSSFALHVIIDPLTGGSHRVGIGLNGTNVGVDFTGALPATPIDLVLSWNGIGIDSILGAPPSSCAGAGAIEIAHNGTSHITGIVASTGSTLTEADPFFVRLASTNDAPRFGFSVDLCGQNLAFDTEDLSDFSSLRLVGALLSGDITTLPSSLHLHREHLAGWQDGIVVSAPGGMDFAITGQAGPSQVAATGHGLERASVMWRGGTSPFVRLGVGLPDPGDSASFRMSLSFLTVTIGAVEQSGGDVRYSNPPFGSLDVAEGACANAYFDLLAECNLGEAGV